MFILYFQLENENALKLLSEHLEFIDTLDHDKRQEKLVRGVLAGNVFDWGAKEVVKLMEDGLGFKEAADKLQGDVSFITSVYPLVPYPHTYIALYSRTPKLPVTHTHTHKNKKLVSIPLKLVPSLAKLPSLVTPFPLGGAPPTPNTSHSSFWRHQSNSSVSPLLTFVR